MQQQQLFTDLIQTLFLSGPNSPQVQKVLENVKENHNDLLPQCWRR